METIGKEGDWDENKGQGWKSEEDRASKRSKQKAEKMEKRKKKRGKNRGKERKLCEEEGLNGFKKNK